MVTNDFVNFSAVDHIPCDQGLGERLHSIPSEVHEHSDPEIGLLVDDGVISLAAQ